MKHSFTQMHVYNAAIVHYLAARNILFQFQRDRKELTQVVKNTRSDKINSRQKAHIFLRSQLFILRAKP